MSVPAGISDVFSVPGWHDPAASQAVDLAAWQHEARNARGEWTRVLSPDEMDQRLQQWFQPQQLEPRQVRHPRSGFMVDAGLGRSPYHPPRTEHGNDSLGTEGPAVFTVKDYGDPTAPGHNSLLYPKDAGTEPIRHVYRGVSEAEWQQAQQRGYLKSDARGTISELEGTNASADPHDAVSYLPRTGRGRVLKIEVRPSEQWFTINADQYLRTRQEIPLGTVSAVSPVLAKEPKYGQVYETGDY